MKDNQKRSFKITHAVIEITSRCNYHCEFCVGRHMSQGDMDLQTYTSILSQLPNLKYLYLSGEGEALLNHHFFEMASMAQKKGISLYHVTNGSLLSKEICIKLIETGFHEINISTETVDPDIFRHIRGGNWQSILNNIENLVKARGNRSLPIIRFNFNALQSTLEQIPRIIELSQSIGIEAPNIFSLQSKNDYVRYYPPLICAEILTHTQRINLVRDIKTNPVPAKFWNTLYTDGYSNYCPYICRFIWVAYNKAITPCCYIKDHSGRWGYATADNGINSAMESEEYLNLENLLKQRKIPSECIGCTVFEFHND